MPKQVTCKDALLHFEPDRLHPHADCDWTASAESVEHVIEALEEHTVDEHKIDLRSVGTELRERVRGSVSESGPVPASKPPLARKLSCRHAGVVEQIRGRPVECDWEGTAPSADEVVAALVEHNRTAHGIDAPDSEGVLVLGARVKDAIEDA